jgi:hypothetical protein
MSKELHRINRNYSSIMNPLCNIIDYNLKQDFKYNKATKTYTITEELYNELKESLENIEKTLLDNHLANLDHLNSQQNNKSTQ